MKLLILVGLLFYFYKPIYSVNETIDWPSMMDLSQAEFGVRLLRRVAKSGKATVVSPFSVAVALVVINTGASGNTQRQLSNVLAKGVSNDHLNSYFKKILIQLSKPLGGFRVNVGTRLFMQRDLKMVKEYTSATGNDYASHIKEVDFHEPALVSQEINKWATKQMNGTRERRLVEPEMFEEPTQMVLISIASFSALWQKPFNTFATRNQTFYQTETRRKKVLAIAQTEYFPYYSDRTISAIALPYKCDKAFMYIFLPKDKYGLLAFERTLTAKKMFRIVRSMERTYVDLVVPKFRMGRRFDLQSTLNRMGVVDAFGKEANFTGVCSKPLSLSNFIHEAFTEVNEFGAKSTTRDNTTEFDWKFIPLSTSQPVKFVADHPFLFAVLLDNTLLFIGRFRG